SIEPRVFEVFKTFQKFSAKSEFFLNFLDFKGRILKEIAMGRTKKSPTKRMETSQEENTEKMITEATSNIPVESSSSDSKSIGKKKAAASLPRGIPKSGRVWKTQKQKQEIKQIKELSRSIKEQKEAGEGPTEAET
uniref:Uncharacterized protein n=2 Tax=Lutzomyia longipalpis TaxID=7200 RepID=A0A1B0C858_LUTLO